MERFRASMATVDAEGYATCCEAIADMDLRPHLSQIARAHLGHRRTGRPCHPAGARHVDRRGRSRATADVLDNAAHLANVEQAAEVTAMMTGFLEEQ